MIDMALLREQAHKVIPLILKKDPHFNVDHLIALDKQVRSARLDIESLRHQKNALADQAKKGVTPEIRATSIEVSKKLKALEDAVQADEVALQQFLLSCPNIPMEDIPSGGKEANEVVRQVGQLPTFSFTPKNHVELGTHLGWFDFDAAARMTGSNFVLYKGDAVKVMYALTMFMLEHNQRHGYSLVLPPYLVNAQSLQVAGNFPKFKDQVYHIAEDQLYLSPTSEVNLANLYRDHIFQSHELPVHMTSWTSCFRREAGGYGATERGLIRIHQFEKVELFTVCEPEHSNKELERMLETAEGILKALNIPYRVSLLAAQDCSFSSAKTYDIEVWMPGQKQFYEVSSCSNCTDFQARRGMIRYKKDMQGKTHLVHTLNGSSLALPRLMVAIMENFQQEDGSIDLPPLLKKYGVW